MGSRRIKGAYLGGPGKREGHFDLYFTIYFEGFMYRVVVVYWKA